MLRLTIKEAAEMRNMIDKKREELKELGKYKGSAYEQEGDGFHDNFAFEQAEIKERGLLREITDLQLKLDEAEIIDIDEEANNANGKVSIGSKVTVKLEFDGEEEEETYTITGGYGNMLKNIVSIQSPLGQCLINKTVGFEGSYTVDGNVTVVKIVEIS